MGRRKDWGSTDSSSLHEVNSILKSFLGTSLNFLGRGDSGLEKGSLFGIGSGWSWSPIPAHPSPKVMAPIPFNLSQMKAQIMWYVRKPSGRALDAGLEVTWNPFALT